MQLPVWCPFFKSWFKGHNNTVHIETEKMKQGKYTWKIKQSHDCCYTYVCLLCCELLRCFTIMFKNDEWNSGLTHGMNWMSWALLMDLLFEHTSLMTLRGQIIDLGKNFNVGFLLINASRSDKRSASISCCMSCDKACFLTVRFLVSTKYDRIVSPL